MTNKILKYQILKFIYIHYDDYIMEKQYKIASNILECIGKTPIVKMNKIPLNHGIKCQLFAKLEFFNPGGSLKDRIGYNMIT